nr:putative ribonuclease H-like domain-containing protein [Tanacetum cinerariifolium]
SRLRREAICIVNLIELDLLIKVTKDEANDGVECIFPLLVHMCSTAELPLLKSLHCCMKDSLLGHILYKIPWPIKGVLSSPLPTQIYSPPKKDLSWTGLPEFVDDTVTDYSMTTPSIDASKCNKSELQSSNFSVFKRRVSTGSIMSKPMIKFVKEADCPRVIKINNTENARKSTMKYAEMYRNTSKGKTWPKDNYAHKSMTPRAVLLEPDTTPIVLKINLERICPRHMTRNISYHSEYEVYDEGYGSFRHGGGKITDHLGKFDAKGDEGYFVGYSLSIKAFRVFNKRTKKVEENLHVDFLENKLIEKGAGPNLLFDIDTLTNSMNYVPVVVTETSSINILGTKDIASQAVKKDVSSLRYIALPNWFHEAHLETSNDTIRNTDAQDDSQKEQDCNIDVLESNGISNPTTTSKVSSTDQVEPAISLIVEYDILTIRVFSQKETPSLGNALSLSNRFEDTFGVEADLSNMETSIPVEAMQEELFQFKIQNVWILVDCPKWVRPIGIKCVLKNKKDERGIVIRNKARLVAQGYTQEEGIDYEEVFAPVARIEAIRLFLAYTSIMGFVVYQMDVKSAFLYGTIDEELYVMQPLGFQDPEFPDRVYKVEKAMYGLHQAPRAWYGTLSKYLLDNGFQRGTIDQTLFIRKHKEEFLLVQVEFEALMHDKFQMSAMGELTFFLGLQVLQKKDGIFLSQEKYVGDILKKFGYSDVGQLILQWTKRILGEKMDLDRNNGSRNKIIATIDGKSRTISESSLRRHLKLNDEEGISSLPDAELFENLSLMGYNILPNQSNIATAVVCLATNRVYNFSKMIFDGMGEGSANLTDPHNTPSPQEHHSPQHDSPPPPHQTIISEPITQAPTETLTPRRLTKRAIRIAQSKALSPVADEPASLLEIRK